MTAPNWPVDLTDAEKAIADQRAALVRDAVDKLLTTGPPQTTDRTGGVIELCMAVAGAGAEVLRASGAGRDKATPVFLHMTAELLHRAVTGGTPLDRLLIERQADTIHDLRRQLAERGGDR